MANTETAIFAAGCFWSVEAAFHQVAGVIDAVSGYTGGTTEQPSYREVCSGRSGHAEAVQVTYDPQKVTYEQLLSVFWRIHDPTTLDRQGPDVGSQYRSAIFVNGDVQRDSAKTSLNREQQNYSAPIVTHIQDAAPFYRAEDYHQRYFEKNGVACHVI